jgi:rubredoxin
MVRVILDFGAGFIDSVRLEPNARPCLIRIKVGASRLRYKARQMKPICPKCNIQMNLVREAAGIGALPTLRTYRCEPCGYVFTEAQGFHDEQRALMLDLRADGEAIPLQ